MKVALIRPDDFGAALPDGFNKVFTDAIIILSTYAPPGSITVFNHDAEGLVSWINELEASIRALRENG